MTYRIISCLSALIVLAPLLIAQQSETGSTYTMSHSVIAGGGAYSQWTQPNLSGTATSSTVPNFEVTGTIGQAIAGTTSTGGAFSLHGGFWFADALQPTAAPATITGRISGAGAYAKRLRVFLIDLTTGEQRFTRISSFGFFRFNDLEVGRTYMLRPVSDYLTFTPDSKVIGLVADVADANFTALQPN